MITLIMLGHTGGFLGNSVGTLGTIGNSEQLCGHIGKPVGTWSNGNLWHYVPTYGQLYKPTHAGITGTVIS
jgi:hypothetical protein